MAKRKLIIESDSNLDSKIFGLICCIARDMETAANKILIKHKLSMTQLYILRILDKNKKEMTVSEIKDQLIDDSPNVSRSLNKLMNNGLITKKRNKEDQRIVKIKITAEGQKTCLDANENMEDLDMPIKLDQNEKEVLFEILKRF